MSYAQAPYPGALPGPSPTAPKVRVELLVKVTATDAYIFIYQRDFPSFANKSRVSASTPPLIYEGLRTSFIIVTRTTLRKLS